MRPAALLVLLAAPALAQDQPDPRRISPLTGEPRPMFEPTSSEESKLVLDACLDRTLATTPAPEAVQVCHAEALASCEAIMALYPLARSTCTPGLRLAWGEVRNQAGLDLCDLTRTRAEPEDDAKTQPQLDALLARDEAWRLESGSACLTGSEAAREACELDREMAQAALYVGEIVALLRAP